LIGRRKHDSPGVCPGSPGRKGEGVTARGLVLMDVLGLRRVMSNHSDQELRGRSRPTGALRLAFRLPIYLYRLGLGQLLGHRFMLLTHRGRRSGRVYQTALEVVRYDPSLRETVVASGWGERSDWYRNLKAHPALEIRSRRERYAPEQQFLTPEEVYQEIVDYERRHPWAVRIVPSVLGFRLDGSDAARRSFANSVRMVAFRPRQGPSSRGRSNHRARFNHALGMGYGGFSKGSYCLLAGGSEEWRIPRMEVHE
jgi:deazaflavin-dependent oxidoreductase (nitroreductase family)